MIRFQVKNVGLVDHGVIISKDRLAWWKGSLYGIATAGQWSLDDATKTSVKFQNACWNGLTPQEREASIARTGQKWMHRSA